MAAIALTLSGTWPAYLLFSSGKSLPPRLLQWPKVQRSPACGTDFLVVEISLTLLPQPPPTSHATVLPSECGSISAS